MTADVRQIGHLPKRAKRFFDPLTPGRTSRLRMGRDYLNCPNAAIDQFDAHDDNRNGKSYITLSDVTAGLTPTWSDIAAGSTINGATKFGNNDHIEPATFAFNASWAANAAGLLLALGSEANGGMTIGFITNPLRLAAVIGDDATKVQTVRQVAAQASAVKIVVAVEPNTGAEPKMKVWIGEFEAISLPHDFPQWQGSDTENGTFQDADSGHMDLDPPFTIGGAAATNVTITTNLTYYKNQLPVSF